MVVGEAWACSSGLRLSLFNQSDLLVLRVKAVVKGPSRVVRVTFETIKAVLHLNGANVGKVQSLLLKLGRRLSVIIITKSCLSILLAFSPSKYRCVDLRIGHLAPHRLIHIYVCFDFF